MIQATLINNETGEIIMNGGGTMNKYFIINEKTTAIAINYLGFKYMQFTNNDGSTIYSFENTKEFQEARTKLWSLRKEYRK